jgi:hypothetical protein
MDMKLRFVHNVLYHYVMNKTIYFRKSLRCYINLKRNSFGNTVAVGCVVYIVTKLVLNHDLMSLFEVLI